jgi:histone H3/H4
MAAVHCKRVTVMKKDAELVKDLDRMNPGDVAPTF